MNTRTHGFKALALDAFGTLIQYGPRLAPYGRLVGARGEGAARLPFLTRDVPVATFAAELGLEHMLPDIEADLAEELAGLRLFSEVHELLARARRAGLRLAVCSNLAAEYGPAVRGLLPDLDAYVLSYEVGVAKPDPAIFQRVCDALGCAPGEVVFVGDSERCDVDGPRAFGMQAHHLDRKRGQTLLDVMDDLEDLAIAEQRLADIRAGKSKTVPLDEVMQMFGDAYDALKANHGAGLSADQVRARLAAQGGQAPDMASIPRRREPMTVADLIATLHGLPQDVPVMLAAEGGIDHARSVRVADVARHPRDWAGTPVGQYRELPDDGHDGSAFQRRHHRAGRERSMKRDELIAAVPVHEYEGRPFYVNLAEIPQPWRDQFWAALYGSQCPKIEGVERAAYAWDWDCWVHGSWYGRHGPEGLQP